MNRKALLGFAALVICSASGLVTADYLELFGTQDHYEQVFKEVLLRPQDSKTGGPILGVHIRCFQKGNSNACTQKQSDKLGYISLVVPAIKVTERTLMFKKDSRFVASKDPNLQVMLIHTDYQSTTRTIELSMVFEQENSTINIPMQLP